MRIIIARNIPFSVKFFNSGDILGIGKTKAENIIKSFSSLYTLFIVSKSDMKAVGIGKETRQEIRKMVFV